MKISVCMGYLNRREQLVRTLHTIGRSAHKDVEVVIVDDHSRPEQRVDDLPGRFPFVRVQTLTGPKTWVNPCIVYNKAFAMATGDVVLIQNPECFHVGDVLKHVADNLQVTQYAVYTALHLTFPAMNQRIGNVAFENNPDLYAQLRAGVQDLVQNLRGAEYIEGCCWMTHPQEKPRNLHFAAALHKSQLDRVGGFNEVFARGVGWEDDEFLRRVSGKLTLVPYGSDVPFVVHQEHEFTSPKVHSVFWQLWERNKTAYSRLA